MSVVLLAWFFMYTAIDAGAEKVPFECVYQDPNDDGYTLGDHRSVGRSLPQKTVGCSSYCYSLWTFDPDDSLNASRFQLISSGCLDGSNQFAHCDRPQCASTVKAIDTMNNTNFCCCSGQICNAKLVSSLDDKYLGGQAVTDDFYDDYTSYMIFLIFVCILFFTFAVISAKFIRFIYASNRMKSPKTNDSLHLLESQCPPLSLQKTPSKETMMMIGTANENLIFTELIGQGKYGPIWKGKFNDTIVVIKICQNKSNEHFWKNESFVYSLPLMSSPNLAKFYGNMERITENGLLEQCLVIEYGHHRSLQSYLTEQTFDWNRMCEIGKSMVQGLAYLHAEIRHEDKSKPSIAHCDLSSANVMVKADGTCMICDFQLAVPFAGGNDSIVIKRSDNVRYLPPEILDDSQRPCESSLKQADIYGLGLILWEIATRCTDLYQGIDVPAFRLPFEHEVGLTPTFKQMELLVSRHKARPLFPDIWKNSNYAIRLLKETITECWDHEPEARLTALCIAERISELPSLWKRHKMEMLSSCYMATIMNTEQQPECRTVRDDEFSSSSSTGTVTAAVSLPVDLDPAENSGSPKNVFYINRFENSLHCKYNDHNHLLHHQHKHLSPLSQVNNAKKHFLNIKNLEKNLNNNQMNGCQPKLTVPLQPHHARNPCMERNLMVLDVTEQHEEILEQGLKFSMPARTKRFDSDTSESNDSTNEDINGSFSENRSLIQSTPMPIPFVQNYPLSSPDDVPNSPTKIKDINRFRNNHHHHVQRNSFFKHNLLGFLKKRFSLITDGDDDEKSDHEYGVHRPDSTLLSAKVLSNKSNDTDVSVNMIISSDIEQVSNMECSEKFNNILNNQHPQPNSITPSLWMCDKLATDKNTVPTMENNHSIVIQTKN